MKLEEDASAETEGPFKKTPEGKLLVSELELLCLLAEHERVEHHENGRKYEPGSRRLADDSPA